MASASTLFNYTDESIRKNSDMFARRGKSLWRDQQGSALMEGAVMVPLVIAFFSGVFEFSWFFYRQHLVAIGLHDAASYLARSSDPCNPTSHAWKAALEQAKNLATTGSLSGGAARIRGWTADSVTPLCTKIDNPIGTNGLSRYRGLSVYVVTVSTKFTYPSLGVLALLKLQSRSISASYSQRAVEPR
jgi:Flp pilus assembly protein TadG